MDMGDDKDPDERDDIEKNYEEIVTTYISLLKMVNFGLQKIYTMMRKNLMGKFNAYG